MTQPTSYQVPAHPSGLDMRTQLNVIILAMIGDNCGPTEPTELYPGMMWGDTTANRLKRRTNANDGWIDIGPLDDFLGDLRTQIAAEAGKCVLKTGDTMTGSLLLQGANIMFKNASQAWYGYMGSYGAAGQAGSGMGFVNAALTAWNFQVGDDGRCNARGGLDIQSGGANIYGRVNMRQAGSYGEIAMVSTDGSCMYIRGRAGGGGLELVNSAYNNVPWTIDDAGTLFTNIGGGRYGNDGNVWMQWYGGWLSDMNVALVNHANTKAPNGAQVQWNSGINELASAMGGQNTVDSSNPWVMEGVRVTTSTDINRIYPRVIWQRNA
ncbi:hypothetical protein HDG32_005527 [Paraburkholderia sp. CI2]|uniref:hypothetical protein n=1 Tax=Paraburkholderia sp. CI2 TaxID=2723093 RepID=UPI0016133FA9|nr:hypothetical protein [Paraburkholderia sp. CI2]MBB5469380.1 hypothetical protein [Paraburkholderia sp. CI2]